ncbi:acetate kinase [bacterium]|nr:acetate kinase [bacterium]
MKILILNCGSSSVKYQFRDTDGAGVLAKGLVERIGIPSPVVNHKRFFPDEKSLREEPDRVINYSEAIKRIIELLLDEQYGVIKRVEEIEAVGHRVVHGGEEFSDSVLITQGVKDKIRECIPLAPLHNPPNLKGIEAAEALLPNVPQVAVFDTAFHQSIPPHAYIYALPYEYYERYRVRRYGFHGTSHFYVAHRAAEILGKNIESLRIITAHLGNGASITAVKGGVSVDTSMGFTPLEGVVMGTRCGDIDPAITFFLGRREKLSFDELDRIMNKKSGLLGISGLSSDMRDIIKGMNEGNPRCKLAFDIYCYRVKKYIGAYAAAMGGLDVLVFTAGVGENASYVRSSILSGLEFLGIQIDEGKNSSVQGEETDISVPGSPVRVLVIPTDEERIIGEDTKRIVEGR